MRVKMDPLQLMGAVRMRVQTADKNITIIHKWSHRLTSYEVKCVLNLNWSKLSADFYFWVNYSFIPFFGGTQMKIFWRMLSTKWFWYLLTFTVWTKNTMEVSTTWNCLVANNILQNIIVCVPQKNTSHTETTWW